MEIPEIPTVTEFDPESSGLIRAPELDADGLTAWKWPDSEASIHFRLTEAMKKRLGVS